MFDVYCCLLPVSVGFSRSYSDALLVSIPVLHHIHQKQGL